MRVTFLCHQLIVTSGQARFLANLARGVASLGCEVTVCALEADAHYRVLLASEGMHLMDGGIRLGGPLNQIRTIRTSPRLSRALARIASRTRDQDWYVVVADEALGVVNHLHRRPMAWLSCGDLSLMYLYPSFYRTEATVKRFLALGMVRSIRAHAAWAARYDRLLALSNFTRDLMSHLYALPFQGVVYPPVDVDAFAPVADPVGDYAVAVARNQREFNLDILEEVARAGSLRVLGGGQVAGATSLGVVDDRTFVDAIANARLLVFPPPAELFGYPVLEALSCGTPALAFDHGGPSELIEHGRSGWLARSRREFVAMATEALQRGYPKAMRMDARKRAQAFSIPRMASRLLEHLT